MLSENMTLEDKIFHSKWSASSGHSGGWRVCRQFFEPLKPEKGMPNFQESKGPSGKLRLFKSFENAKKFADKLNKGN